MYVRPTSTRLLSGMLTPAMRAMALPLTLLVTRVLADHEHRAVAANDLALLAHGLDRRSDLHAPRSTFENLKRTALRAQETARRQNNSEKIAGAFRPGQAACSTSRSASSSCHGVRIRGPAAVIAIVNSKWAASEPSWEYTDQLSRPIRMAGPPTLTIGSTARTMPSSSSGPLPGGPKFGIWGSSCMSRPIPCPTSERMTAKPSF